MPCPTEELSGEVVLSKQGTAGQEQVSPWGAGDWSVWVPRILENQWVSSMGHLKDKPDEHRDSVTHKENELGRNHESASPKEAEPEVNQERERESSQREG